MRKANLFRSIVRFLDPGTVVVDAAYMWKRHRLMFPFTIGAFGLMVMVAGAAGWSDWATRVVLGMAAAAIAVTATTDYAVLAATSGGIFLLRASRIRQVAIAMVERLPDDVEIAPVGGSVLAADWEVGGNVYTVPRSYERAMSGISAHS